MVKKLTVDQMIKLIKLVYRLWIKMYAVKFEYNFKSSNDTAVE